MNGNRESSARATFARIACASAILAGFALFAAEAPSGTAVTIYRPTDCIIRLEVYPRPLHLRYGQLEQGVPRPDWYEANLRLERLPDYEFADWIRYFSSEHIARFGLNPESFAAAKRGFNPDRSSSALESALWTTYVDVGTRKFCFATFFPVAHLDTTPARSAEAGGPLLIRSFELIDGIWKHQLQAQTDVAALLPVGKLREMEAIIAARKGIIDGPLKEARALVEPKKAP